MHLVVDDDDDGDAAQATVHQHLSFIMGMHAGGRALRWITQMVRQTMGLTHSHSHTHLEPLPHARRLQRAHQLQHPGVTHRGRPQVEPLQGAAGTYVVGKMIVPDPPRIGMVLLNRETKRTTAMRARTVLEGPRKLPCARLAHVRGVDVEHLQSIGAAGI